MNSKTIVLCSILAFPVMLAGCSTSPQQETQINSGIRLATMAYVLKGGSAETQQVRAEQVLATTAEIRAHISETGEIVPDLNALAVWANAMILNSESLSAEDKRLLQAVVLEAIFILDDSIDTTVSIGAANAARVLRGLAQADRVAVTMLGG